MNRQQFYIVLKTYDYDIESIVLVQAAHQWSTHDS